MAKIILDGFILIPEAYLEEVILELPNHIKATLNEEGCLCFVVTQDPNVPKLFHVYEEFKSKAAFDAHQSRT